MDDKLSRRDVLQQSAALGALVVLGAAACNKPAALTCTDTTGLSATDLQVRTSLAYVDASTEPGKTCANCQQFVAPAAAGTCGSCKVLKGPINPSGYCKSYVAKTT
jgi:FtsP/CotA-like multicopper oxidase with cupredoxin domain